MNYKRPLISPVKRISKIIAGISSSLFNLLIYRKFFRFVFMELSKNQFFDFIKCCAMP